jgi:DNA-binding HxlR family transcriptional regulator
VASPADTEHPAIPTDTPRTADQRERLQQAMRPAAIQQALEIFNDSWSFAVLQELFFGVRRFDDFQRNLEISRSVLTRRLRHLEERDIIHRKIYSARPQRYEYRLTERGLDMYPFFVLLRQWGEKWLPDASDAGIQLHHRPCGNPLHITLHCRDCGEEISARDVNYELMEQGTRPTTKAGKI